MKIAALEVTYTSEIKPVSELEKEIRWKESCCKSLTKRLDGKPTLGNLDLCYAESSSNTVCEWLWDHSLLVCRKKKTAMQPFSSAL